MSRDKFNLFILGCLLCVVTTWSLLNLKPSPDIAWLERNATIVTGAARTQRLRADSASKASVRQEGRVNNTATLLNTATLATQATVDSAKAVLADTSATLATVRSSLVSTVIRVDSLIAVTFQYRADVDAYRDTVATERAETSKALTMWADSVPKAQAQAVAAYKREIRKLRLQQAAWVLGTTGLLYVVAK